jgi:Spy/CpxP family protein refolding chaperone
MTRTPALAALFLVVVWMASPSGQNASGARGRLPTDSSRSTTKLPARWWKDPAIAKVVGLTTFQADRIDTLFDEFMKPQRERWTALRPLEKQLEDLLREPNPDEKLVFDRITTVENRRSEMNRNRLMMLFQIQRVLSPSQRSKLQDLGHSPFLATESRNAKTPR